MVSELRILRSAAAMVESTRQGEISYRTSNQEQRNQFSCLEKFTNDRFLAMEEKFSAMERRIQSKMEKVMELIKNHYQQEKEPKNQKDPVIEKGSSSHKTETEKIPFNQELQTPIQEQNPDTRAQINRVEGALVTTMEHRFESIERSIQNPLKNLTHVIQNNENRRNTHVKVESNSSHRIQESRTQARFGEIGLDDVDVMRFSSSSVILDLGSRDDDNRVLRGVVDRIGGSLKKQKSEKVGEIRGFKILSGLIFDDTVFDSLKKDEFSQLHKVEKQVWVAGKNVWVKFELGRPYRSHTEYDQRTAMGKNGAGGSVIVPQFLMKFFPKVYRRDELSVGSTNQYCKFDSEVLTLFTSSLYIAAFISSLCALTITRKLGRDATMIFGRVLFFIGAAINAAAMNLFMLIVGRMFLGFGIGFAHQSVPIYFSEKAFQLLITIGILIANILNYFAKIDGGWGWRLSLGGAMVPDLIITIGSLCLPDTPNSLTERGKCQEAKDQLINIRGTKNIDMDFEDLTAASEASKKVAHPWADIVQRKLFLEGGAQMLLAQIIITCFIGGKFGLDGYPGETSKGFEISVVFFYMCLRNGFYMIEGTARLVGADGPSSTPSQSSSNLVTAEIEATTNAQPYDTGWWNILPARNTLLISRGEGAQSVSRDGSTPNSGFVWDEASGYYYDPTFVFYNDGIIGLYYGVD